MNLKTWDWHKGILYAVIVVGCWILFSRECKCKPAPIEDHKPTQTIKEQEKTVEQIEALKQHQADSFSLVLKFKDSLADKYYNNWVQSDHKLFMAERAVDDLLNDSITTVPDTCKAVVAQIQLGFNAVKKTYAEKDKQAMNAINALKSVNQTQKDFLKNKDSIYAKLKNQWDTCIASAKYYKQGMDNNKPKRNVYAGITVLGNPNKYLNGYGINLGLTNKKGTSFELSAINIGTTINYGIGIKKTLFRF